MLPLVVEVMLLLVVTLTDPEYIINNNFTRLRNEWLNVRIILPEVQANLK